MLIYMRMRVCYPILAMAGAFPELGLGATLVVCILPCIMPDMMQMTASVNTKYLEGEIVFGKYKDVSLQVFV